MPHSAEGGFIRRINPWGGEIHDGVFDVYVYDINGNYFKKQFTKKDNNITHP